MPQVTGIIVDSDHLYPLAGVGVTVGSETTATGSDGSFSVELPAGTYTLLVRTPIYRPLSQTVQIPDAGLHLGTIPLHKAVPI